MLKAVAFDMDDTLLSINLSAFIAVFAKDTTMLLADISGKGIVACAAAYSTALLNLNNNAREDRFSTLTTMRVRTMTGGRTRRFWTTRWRAALACL